MAQPGVVDPAVVGVRVEQPRASPTAITNETRTPVRDLSGIAWVGGSQWFAVSDKARVLVRLRVETGEAGGVEAAWVSAVDEIVTEQGEWAGRDLEDLGGVSDGAAVLIQEGGYRWMAMATAVDGVWRMESSVALWRREDESIDPDRGFEACASRADESVWSTEEAVRSDGGRSTFARGSLVRFRDGERAWPYRTDPINGDMPGTDLERSGVVALEFLTGDAADRRLLVLERAAGLTGLRARLYLVDLDEARADAETPLTKQLLWQRTSRQRHENYEGMSMGPTLDDGRRVLLLVADNGGRGPNVVLPLVVGMVDE